MLAGQGTQAESLEHVGFLTQNDVFIAATQCTRDQAKAIGWREVFAAPSPNSPVGGKDKDQ